MAYNESIAERVAVLLSDADILFYEKKMFGGMAFMINDKMCVGVVKDDLMVRVMEDKYEEALQTEHVKPMEFTGKPMKGFIFVELEGISTNKNLQKWIDLGLEFAEFGVLKTKKVKSE